MSWGDLLVFLIIGGILAGVAVGGVWVAAQNLGGLLIVAALLAVVAGIVFAVWYLIFRKPEIKITDVMKHDLISAAMLSREGVAKYSTGLYLRGSREGGAGFRLGKPLGTAGKTVRDTLGGKKVPYKNKETGKVEVLIEGGAEYEIRETAFYFKNDRGILGKIFGAKEIICVFDYRPFLGKGTEGADAEGWGEWVESHSPFVGDIVLYGNFPVRVGKYFYLDTQVSSFPITKFRDNEAITTEIHLFMNNYNYVAEGALHANPAHIAGLESREMLDQSPMLPTAGAKPQGVR